MTTEESRYYYLRCKIAALAKKVCTLEDQIEEIDIGGGNGGGGTTPETDPVFMASPSSSITSNDIDHWDVGYDLSHFHPQLELLDSITESDVFTWTEAANAKHTHANFSVLNSITGQNVTDWNSAVTNSHTHSNKATLDGITPIRVSGWDAAGTASHTHSNKALLDAFATGGGTTQYFRGDGSLATFPTVPTSADYVDRTTAQSVGGVKSFTATPTFATGLTPATDLGSAIGTSALKFSSAFIQTINAVGPLRLWSSGSNAIVFGQTSDATTVMSISGTTGNVVMQAPGSIPSTGFRLDVRGTSRFTGQVSVASTGFISLFGTTDETTNYERLSFGFGGGIFAMYTERGGSGTVRNLQIGSGVATSFVISASDVSRFLFVSSDGQGNTTDYFQIRHLAFSGSAIHQKSFSMYPVVNQSGTASFSNIYVSTYIQGSGSGTKHIMRLGTNTAAQGAGTHTDLFTVSSTGYIVGADDFETIGTGKGYIVKDSDGSRRRITTINGVINVSAAL